MNNRTAQTALAFILLLATATAAAAQSTAGAEIDACGVLVRDGNCVLFEGGGGRFVLSDYGGFNVGDPVRVVGTIDENCITICDNADGCIRGAVAYDPAVLPCGTPISVPFDPCSGLSAGLTMMAVVGLARGRRHG